MINTLNFQIKEREERDIQYKNWIKEQGEIWKRQDEISKIEDKALAKAKKNTQKEFKRFYDSQLRDKTEFSLNEMRLSPLEKQINKNLYYSTLKEFV